MCKVSDDENYSNFSQDHDNAFGSINGDNQFQGCNDNIPTNMDIVIKINQNNKELINCNGTGSVKNRNGSEQMIVTQQLGQESHVTKDMGKEKTFMELFGPRVNIKDSHKTAKNPTTYVSGHRGGFKPENTLYSFQQAKKHGLDIIELDVSNYKF